MRAVHLRIGRRLITLGDDRLFEAARHVGVGGLAVSDEAERTRFVEVLRRAAHQARAQASFPWRSDTAATRWTCSASNAGPGSSC